MPEDLTEGLRIEEAQRAVLARVYAREGDRLTFDPCTLETPLSRVLDHERAIGELLKNLDEDSRRLLEEKLGQTLDDLLVLTRVRALQVLLDWLAGDAAGPLPRKVLKRFYLFARAISPDHVWRMNQTDIGDLLGLSRAAMCEGEKTEVEAFVRMWTQTEYTSSGGKSSGARARYSRDKRGNHNRKGGKKKDHYFEAKDKR